MIGTTFLMRQINPVFIQADRVTSQAFKPTPKDEKMLSCFNGDRVSAEESWRFFTSQQRCSSAGVMAITKEECEAAVLPLIEDSIGHPAHVSIDFSALGTSAIVKTASVLANHARNRGWLYQQAE